MPVVRIQLDRFERMVGAPREKILERLPYLGLDIEGTEEESVRVEYNPNRPDFSTDVGIARGLRGIMGIELGVPRYRVLAGGVKVRADRNPPKVRPFIACALAKRLNLDDEGIRQLISMQEDLHNGLGRKRRKVSIGLHNLDAVSPPVHYEGVSSNFTFVPLGETRQMTIKEVLTKTKTGKTYADILGGAVAFPILRDSKGMVLSFPPIINGVATKVDTSVKNLFIDVTSTEEAPADSALAILLAALADAGAKLESVKIVYPRRIRTTPELAPQKMRLDQALIRGLTGLDLTPPQTRSCLRKSRLDTSGGVVTIPRYRTDIIHPADIAEEVAIGYGLDKIEATYPPSPQPGQLDRETTAENRLGELMAQSGFIETMNFELIDRDSLYAKFGRDAESALEVQDSRSADHSVLRDSLLPSLMMVLGREVKEEYPQRVFEVGRTYWKSGGGVREGPRLAALTAHSSASFSEAKMYLEALFSAYSGAELVTRAASHWAFEAGRCAEVLLRGAHIGYVGEMSTLAIASFGLQVPVSGFEVDVAAGRPVS